MKTNLLLCLLTAFVLTGCTDTPQEVQAKENTNQYNANHPYKVCTLQDGRDIFVVQVRLPNIMDYHYVYFLKNKDTNVVTINNTEGSGKTSHQVTTVIIDGKEYNLVPK